MEHLKHCMPNWYKHRSKLCRHLVMYILPLTGSPRSDANLDCESHSLDCLITSSIGRCWWNECGCRGTPTIGIKNFDQELERDAAQWDRRRGGGKVFNLNGQSVISRGTCWSGVVQSTRALVYKIRNYHTGGFKICLLIPFFVQHGALSDINKQHVMSLKLPVSICMSHKWAFLYKQLWNDGIVL